MHDRSLAHAQQAAIYTQYDQGWLRKQTELCKNELKMKPALWLG